MEKVEMIITINVFIIWLEKGRCFGVELGKTKSVILQMSKKNAMEGSRWSESSCYNYFIN